MEYEYEVIFTGFYKGGYDIFILSDISGKLIEIKDIINSKWRDETKNEFLKGVKINNINNHSSSLKNFQFTPNSLNNLSVRDEEKKAPISYSDSMGLHIAQKYKTNITLDYAGAQVQYDVIQQQGQGMATFLFSDVLGDHKIGFQTSLVIDLKQSDIIFNYVNLKNRINWATQIYSFSYPGQLYFDSINGEEFYDLMRDMNFGFIER